MFNTGRILIIDSDSPMQRVLSAVVMRNHFEPVVINDGTSALLHLATEDFDVILLELAIPQTDGSELLRVLGSVMPHLLERVIVVTSAPDESIAKCEQIGFTWKVLRKPLQIELLEQELLECYAERMRVAVRRPARRSSPGDLEIPIELMAN